MADSRMVADLDLKLMEEGIIEPSYRDDYQNVHDMLNTHVRKTGRILSEETFDTGDAALRKWLMTLFKQGASQEKLTSYLRCGLAHLCFDFIESTYQSIALDDLVTRALQSFKLRNFHTTYFKVAPTALKAKKGSAAVKKKAPARKKPAIKKKAETKKKPAVKKKPVVKKKAVVKKKPATKKKTAIKKPVKKTSVTAKKKTVKKAIKKKTAAAGVKKKSAVKKKTPVKKPAVKKAGAGKRPAAKKSARRKPRAKKGILSRIFG